MSQIEKVKCKYCLGEVKNQEAAYHQECLDAFIIYQKETEITLIRQELHAELKYVVEGYIASGVYEEVDQDMEDNYYKMITPKLQNYLMNVETTSGLARCEKISSPVSAKNFGIDPCYNLTPWAFCETHRDLHDINYFIRYYTRCDRCNKIMWSNIINNRNYTVCYWCSQKKRVIFDIQQLFEAEQYFKMEVSKKLELEGGYTIDISARSLAFKIVNNPHLSLRFFVQNWKLEGWKVPLWLKQKHQDGEQIGAELAQGVDCDEPF